MRVQDWFETSYDCWGEERVLMIDGVRFSAMEDGKKNASPASFRSLLINSLMHSKHEKCISEHLPIVPSSRDAYHDQVR